MAIRLSPRDHRRADRLQRGGKADQSADSRHPNFTEKLQQLHMKNISVRKAKVPAQSPALKGSGSQHAQGALPQTQHVQGRTVSWDDTEFTESLRLEKAPSSPVCDQSPP